MYGTVEKLGLMQSAAMLDRDDINWSLGLLKKANLVK